MSTAVTACSLEWDCGLGFWCLEIEVAGLQLTLSVTQSSHRTITAAMACQCQRTTIAPTSLSYRQPVSSVLRKPLLVASCARSLATNASKYCVLGSCWHAQLHSGHPGRLSVHARTHSARRRQQVVAQAYNQKPDIADRVVASVPYLIPLIDGLRYGERGFDKMCGELQCKLNSVVCL